MGQTKSRERERARRATDVLPHEEWTIVTIPKRMDEKKNKKKEERERGKKRGKKEKMRGRERSTSIPTVNNYSAKCTPSVGDTLVCRQNTYIFIVHRESNTLNNELQKGFRGGRVLRVRAVEDAGTRHGLPSNARRKHRRNEREENETASRCEGNPSRFANITSIPTGATASTLPVVPVGGGGRHTCTRVVGTFTHYRL